MSEFHLTILGCGSALPASGRQPSSQYLVMGKHRFLIDCGEGTQHLLRKHHLKFQSISHIFISHMHGDHFLGLMGLLFSMTLLGRSKSITLVGPSELKELIDMHLKHAKAGLKFKIEYKFTQAEQEELVVETPSCLVYSIPLDHKIATTGFIFKEKERPRKLIGKKLEYYNVPLKVRKAISLGEDFTMEDGTVIPNSKLTQNPIPPSSYAYCSDTAYIPSLHEKLKGVDLLYHESTFCEAEKARAVKTRHSTAAQAAQVAKESEVQRLLLGHYSARYTDLSGLLAEAQEVFEKSVLSHEGMSIDIHSLHS